VSVEFAFGVPALLFVVLSGIVLGRALLTRHRLADATGFAARAAVVRDNMGPDEVRMLVQQELGEEASRCTALNVHAVVIPEGAGPDQDALEVTTTCVLEPIFNSDTLSVLTPGELTVTAAMPLQR
jgi:Flp pilus assembly protein TadG